MDEQRKAVRLMQDYISKHIDEDISIDDLAKEVSFSTSYARKIFSKALGMTPAVYVRRLKLTESARSWMWHMIWDLEVSTDISAHSDVSSAVIQRNIPQAPFPSGCLLLR